MLLILDKYIICDLEDPFINIAIILIIPDARTFLNMKAFLL